MDYITINRKRYVTPKDIQEAIIARGITVSVLSMHWHCRRGRLATVAMKRANLWYIPIKEAQEFASTYTKQRGGAHTQESTS